jgi:hypothetical protein
MARPLRIQYANACYHVLNRGDNRRPIFSREEDYHLVSGVRSLIWHYPLSDFKLCFCRDI